MGTPISEEGSRRRTTRTPARPVIVRPGRPDEAPLLSVLAREAKASWGYPAAWLRAWEAELTFTADYVRDHGVFVADVEGRPAGVVAVELDEPDPELAHLWVHPASQGLGVGSALLGRAARHASSFGATALRIVSDPNAVAFYERRGAEQVGEVSAAVCGVDRMLPVMRLRIGAIPEPLERGGAPGSR